jgi:hypothetical protein
VEAGANAFQRLLGGHRSCVRGVGRVYRRGCIGTVVSGNVEARRGHYQGQYELLSSKGGGKINTLLTILVGYG